MANTVNLDELLRSIHNAVLEAQKLTEQQHLRQLHKYFVWDADDHPPSGDPADDIFNKPGKARTWTVEVPSLHPAAKSGDTMQIKVPLMSLIPPTAIKIKNMVVEFKVGLKGFENPEGDLKSATHYLPGDPEQHKGPIMVDLNSSSGGLLKKPSSLAKVKIEFEAGDPAESFLRINDHLIKSIV